MSFNLGEEDVSKKVQLWGVVGELANLNLIMGVGVTGTIFNWVDIKKKNYNYQRIGLKPMCKDIMTECNGCPKL